MVLNANQTPGFDLSWSDTDCHTNAYRQYSVWQVHHGRFEEIMISKAWRNIGY